MLTIHGSEPGQGVQRVGVGRRDRAVVDRRIVAQPGELAHRRLRSFGLLDVGHHAARDFHRDERIGIDVRVDRDFSRLEFLRGIRDRLGVCLDLRLDLGCGLFDLRLFHLAAGRKRQDRGGGECGPSHQAEFARHLSLPFPDPYRRPDGSRRAPTLDGGRRGGGAECGLPVHFVPQRPLTGAIGNGSGSSQERWSPTDT
ncbi:MAG: hypothetical protein H6R11_2423 [Proteobacteria bacterium]|nr:hypothetical protein [Pseudomonadota bacterium]